VAGALALAATIYFCFAFLVREPKGRSRVLPITAIGILLAAFYLLPLPAYVYAFGDKPLFENFVERNVSFFNRARYSDAFRNKLNSTPIRRVCHAGSGLKLNVILVIVESLSAYHSKYFSGIEDWTPRLDRLARMETALTNFHANGWTTIGGLISILTGTFPFVPEQAEFNEWGSPRLDDFAHIPETLPRSLASNGYQTTFVSAGDLAFLGQDEWLRAIGYERIVGNNDPRFAKQKVRGPFGSVPDRLLYEVVLDEIDMMKSAEPYFITAQTLWSHRPFMAPDGSALHSEEHVIRMTDQMLGELYDTLLAEGFFENGILFVTGDHRAMEPYRKAEFDRFGATAFTRIPGLIVSDAIELPPEIVDDHQQRDLAASIRALVQDEYCVDQFEGTVLGPNPAPPACIMHARGDDRDLILVKCGDREGVVRVAGDATAVVSGSVPDDVAVIQTINKNRIRNRTQVPAVQAAEAH